MHRPDMKWHSLRRFTRVGRRRARIDAVVSAYANWRRECAAVRLAYRRWARGAGSDSCSAFAAYRLALDREERAAAVYARLLRRVRCWPEFEEARQLVELPALFGVM